MMSSLLKLAGVAGQQAFVAFGIEDFDGGFSFRSSRGQLPSLGFETVHFVSDAANRVSRRELSNWRGAFRGHGRTGPMERYDTPINRLFTIRKKDSSNLFPK